MRLTYERMRELLPSLNKRRITWRMIERACRKLDTDIFCIPLKLDGYFVPAALTASGRSEIYINSGLSDDRQIATAVHEIKHAACDQPLGQVLLSCRRDWTAAARRQFDRHRKHEMEAYAIGAMALIPESKLKHASRHLFEPEDEFLEDVWVIRIRTRETYKL